MAEFFAMRNATGLLPHTMEDAAELQKLPFAKPLLVSVKAPRNGRHHSLYWVLCARIASAVGAEPETVSDTLKIATGHCTIVQSKTFGTLRLPKSISWAKMDDTAFRDFFNRCVAVIVSEWGIARTDVLEAVKDLIDAGTEKRG